MIAKKLKLLKSYSWKKVLANNEEYKKFQNEIIFWAQFFSTFADAFNTANNLALNGNTIKNEDINTGVSDVINSIELNQ